MGYFLQFFDFSLSTLSLSLSLSYLTFSLMHYFPFSLCTHGAQSSWPTLSKSKPSPISSRPHESKTPSLVTNLIPDRWDRNSSRPRVFLPFSDNTNNRGSRPPSLDWHRGWEQSPIIKCWCFVRWIFQDLPTACTWHTHDMLTNVSQPNNPDELILRK